MDARRRTVRAVASAIVLASCSGSSVGELQEVVTDTLCEPGSIGVDVRTGDDWNLGESRRFEIRTVVTAGDVPDLDGIDGERASLRVTGAGEVRSAVWESDRSRLLDALVLPAGFAGEVERTGSVLPGDAFDYVVAGNIVTITDISAARRSVIELLEQLQVDGALDVHSSLRNQMAVDELDDAELAGLMIRPPTIYHVLDGFELASSDSVSFPDALPNGFGGEPFPATSTLSVETSADADGCVSVVQTTVADPDEFRRVFAAELERRGAPTAGPVFEAALEDFSVERRYVGQFDAATGRLRQIRGEQFTQAGDQAQRSVTVITDVTPG